MSSGSRSEHNNPFAPVFAEELANNEIGRHDLDDDAEIWEPALPAPVELPSLDEVRHSRYGTASALWVYRSATGAPLFAMVRFETGRLNNGAPGKAVLPYSYGRRTWTPSTGPRAGERVTTAGWHYKLPNQPLQLYGLDRLSGNRDAPVLVCEGEKAADAGSIRFPTMVSLTSQGGSQAPNKSDWSPLAGRDVTIYPDNDHAGLRYAEAVATLAAAAGAKVVRLVQPPCGLPPGWDLADDVPARFVESMPTELVASATVLSLRADALGRDAIVTAEMNRVVRLSDQDYESQRAPCAKALGIRVVKLDALRAEIKNAAGSAKTDDDHDTPAKPEGRKDLYINQADLPDSARKLALALSKRNDLFDRGGPSRLVCDPDGGVSVVSLLTKPAVVIACHEVLRPWTSREGKEAKTRQNVTLPDRVAELYLNMPDAWGLRRLDGIACTPLLHQDGSIQLHDGYDPQLKLWCEKVPEFQIPLNPTIHEARTALRDLRWKFRTFAFADGQRIAASGSATPVVNIDLAAGEDESAFLIMLLTAVCRPSLRLAPGLIIRAPTISGSGTGKGLLARALCLAAFGIQPRAMTLGTRQEEIEKRLTAALIGAEPVVFLDNVNGVVLKSDVLASAITERPASVRPLGTSNTVPLNSSALIVLTGNGLQLSEDMARRFITVELDAGMEDPESRDFRGDFLGGVLAARSEILCYLLTIWRWGRKQGIAFRPAGPLEASRIGGGGAATLCWR